MHDKTTTLEEKVKKWQSSLDHFIGTENWTKEENELTIQLLKQIIQNFEKILSEINPNFDTNGYESFNRARTTLADKDTGWRISWRLRAYVSIIRWNDENWIQRILKSFEIYDVPLTNSKKQEPKELQKNLRE